MLDHLFLSVSDIAPAVAFHDAALTPLGITQRHDCDGKDGPPGHPDLKGLGAAGRMFFWLRKGIAQGQALHVGFIADSVAAVDAAWAAAMRAGATDNGAPGALPHHGPRYCAANVLDPDGYCLEFVYKSWQRTR